MGPADSKWLTSLVLAGELSHVLRGRNVTSFLRGREAWLKHHGLLIDLWFKEQPSPESRRKFTCASMPHTHTGK